MNGVAQRCKRRHLEYNQSQPDSRECQRPIRHLSVLCFCVAQQSSNMSLFPIYIPFMQQQQKIVTVTVSTTINGHGHTFSEDGHSEIVLWRSELPLSAHVILQWLMAMSAGYMYSSDFEQCFVAEITRYAACSLPLSSANSDKHLFGFAFRQQLSHVIAPQTEGMMILRAPGKIWNMISNRRT